MRFGIGTVEDLTWKQMVDSMSCTECGRCQEVCPAWATGKTLSPKLRDHGRARPPVRRGAARARRARERRGLRRAARRRRPADLEEMAWDCVTCGACVRECPVNIEHVDHILDLRRHLVMVESRFPSEAEPMLRDVERQSNPWGKPQSERADWAEGLGVRVLQPGDPVPEVLYWVGCAASFDERARTSAQSTAKLLAGGRRRLRDPRPARGLQRRPRAADGQRVRLPGLRRAERRDAQRGRRAQDRRQLPALLQHARERVPRLRRQLRGRAPHRAARRARARGPALAGRRARERSPTTTPATSPATTTCSPSRASSPRRSASRSRWSAAASARSAAAPAARTCGWRRTRSRSTRSACARRPRPAPRRSPSRARSAR